MNRVPDQGIGKISSSFQRPISFISLDIEFEFLKKLINLSSNKMKRDLERLIFLKNLNLQLDQYAAQTEERSLLAEVFKKTKHLKRVSLCSESRGWVQIRDDDQICFFEALSTLAASLQAIKMKFPSFNSFTDEGLQAISNLTKNYQLQEIDLNFSRCYKIKDQGFISFLSLISEHSQFKKICLDFNYCHQITENGIITFAESLKGQTSLESLSLNFESCGISEIGFQSVSEALKELSCLEHLDLNLREAKTLSNRFFDSFKENVPNSLKILKFNLMDCSSLNAQCMASFGESLKKLNLLENMTLIFFSFKTASHPCFVNLSSGFQNFQNLKSLHLTFHSFGKITDKSFTTLTKNLEKSTKLESIHLDFNRCAKLTDESLNGLSRCLKGFPLLYEMDLNFGSCTQMTDAGLDTLSKCFERLPLLTKVSLKFDYCKQIADPGLASLKRGLERSSSLRKAILQFSYTGITSQYARDFVKSWKQINPLKEVLLICLAYQWITENYEG